MQRGHRVAVAPVVDGAVASGATVGQQAGVETLRWQGVQRLLCHPTQRRDPGRAMNTHVGDARQPLQRLLVQVVEVDKVGADPEVLADVANAAFHFTFGLGTIRATGIRA